MLCSYFGKNIRFLLNVYNSCDVRITEVYCEINTGTHLSYCMDVEVVIVEGRQCKSVCCRRWRNMLWTLNVHRHYFIYFPCCAMAKFLLLAYF